MNSPDRESIALEAKRWVVRLDGLSNQEQAQLDGWLQQSDEHRTEFAAARKDWESMAFLRQLQNDAGEQGDPWVAKRWVANNSAAEEHVPRQRTRRYAWPLAAAVAAMVVMIGWALLPGDYRTEYYTEVGDRLDVTLPDGSGVLLNTNSRIKVHFTDEERNVFLDSGEVHFQVSHDPSRPFVVLADTGVVRAVGTAFTVYVHEEQMEVTVMDGEVEISKQPKHSAATAVDNRAVDNGEPVQRLIAAQTARISPDRVEAATAIDPDTIERKLAWHNGMLEFVNAPLSEVIADAGRYTSKTLEIADSELENYRVTIIARTDNIDGLLRNLDRSTDAFAVKHVSASRVLISIRK